VPIDLAGNSRIGNRALRGSLPVHATTTARQTILLDRRRQPASFDDTASSSETRIVLKEYVDFTSALPTFVDGPDDE